MEKLLVIDGPTGQHRILWGDSTKQQSYEQVMQQERATFLLADPPYCLLTRRNKKSGKLRDPKRAKINHEAVTRFENIKAYHHFTEQWLTLAVDCLTEDAMLCIWTNFLGIKPITDVLLSLGDFHLWGEFQWCKLTTEKNSGNERLGRLYEVGLIFSKKRKPLLSNEQLPLVWSVVGHYDQDRTASQWQNHPNHKPFSLLEPLIRQFSRPGERILDPFCGSGSTPAAAIKLGRLISGIELRQQWAKITQQRISVE